MKTITLKSKIAHHYNTNGGHSIREAKELIANIKENQRNLWKANVILLGLGLDSEILTIANKRIVFNEYVELRAGLNVPMISVEVLPKS